MVKYFPGYLITMAKSTVNKEPFKYLGSICIFVLFLHVQKEQSICDKKAFLYFI